MDDIPPPLPGWVTEQATPGDRFEEDEAALDAAIALAEASAANGGGPFGAVLVDRDREAISVGWNRVIEARDSTAHAEIEALRAAQLRLDTHDLREPAQAPFTLFSSCAPCVMCFGAIYWSGLDRVVAAARAEDAERLGFLEGPVTEEMWARARKEKSIAFEPEADTSRDPGAPFEVYEEQGGQVY